MKSVPWPALRRISEITFEITNRCNLRCRICSIWKERPALALDPADIARVMNSFPTLNSVALTGGEALLHPDFDRIYRDLYSRFLRKKIFNIDIATNAASPLIKTFLARNKRFLDPLTCSVSLDGMSSAHDRQRGVPGAFRKTIANIQLLTKTGVPVSAKFVASALNYQDLPKVDALARALDCDLNIKIVEELGTYYHRHQNKTPVLSKKQSLELLNVLEALSARDLEPLSRLSQQWHKEYLQTGTMDFLKMCVTPAQTLFITCRGDIFNCLYQDSIGNIRDWPSIDQKKECANVRRGSLGHCPKCLAYHGSLREMNIPSKAKSHPRSGVNHGAY